MNDKLCFCLMLHFLIYFTHKSIKTYIFELFFLFHLVAIYLRWIGDKSKSKLQSKLQFTWLHLVNKKLNSILIRCAKIFTYYLILTYKLVCLGFGWKYELKNSNNFSHFRSKNTGKNNI
jgi:hypothetical protein